MGAWETGPFDNDAAIDGIEDIKEESFSTWLDDVESEYSEEKHLDSDIGSTIVAISALIVGFRYEGHEEKEKRSWDRYISSITSKEVRRLKKLLKIVLSNSKKSELYSLWLEDSEAFNDWKKSGLNVLKQLR